jgi:hypothetical protein
MARAIVRYSVSGEASNATGNQVRGILEAVGFERRGRTAALEVDGAALPDIFQAIRDALDLLEAPPGGGTLDHVWVYVDEAAY